MINQSEIIWRKPTGFLQITGFEGNVILVKFELHEYMMAKRVLELENVSLIFICNKDFTITNLNQIINN